MALDLTEKYFVRKSTSAVWEDLITKFDGLKVLSLTGMNSLGKPVNIYTEQWLTGDGTQEEDFMITTEDSQHNPIVIRENVDLSLTFIVSPRYAENDIDPTYVHDSFIEYITSSDFYIKSVYTGKEVHGVVLKEYKPTTESLHRGNNSYIMGTIEIHTLAMPEVSPINETVPL